MSILHLEIYKWLTTEIPQALQRYLLLFMLRNNKLPEIQLLQDFFRKNHKLSLTCDQTKVDFTSSEITPLLSKDKSNFSQDKVFLTGPIMHGRYQPLWFAILLDLNARQPTEQGLQFCFSLGELIEKTDRVSEAIGLRKICYTPGEVLFFLLMMIEFRIEIQTDNIRQTCAVFSEINHNVDCDAVNRVSFTVNPRIVTTLLGLTNAVSVFLTTLFFAKRPEVFDLHQKLLSEKEVKSLSEIAPATFKHVQLLGRFGFITYTKKRKLFDIHSISVFVEGVSPL